VCFFAWSQRGDPQLLFLFSSAKIQQTAIYLSDSAGASGSHVQLTIWLRTDFRVRINFQRWVFHFFSCCRENSIKITSLQQIAKSVDTLFSFFSDCIYIMVVAPKAGQSQTGGSTFGPIKRTKAPL